MKLHRKIEYNEKVCHAQELGSYTQVQGHNMVRAGLEKLTNANRSVSTVNDRLFPVEVTEIADWKSMSEYMLHSNWEKP